MFYLYYDTHVLAGSGYNSLAVLSLGYLHKEHSHLLLLVASPLSQSVQEMLVLHGLDGCITNKLASSKVPLQWHVP